MASFYGMICKETGTTNTINISIQLSQTLMQMKRVPELLFS